MLRFLLGANEASADLMHVEIRQSGLRKQRKVEIFGALVQQESNPSAVNFTQRIIAEPNHEQTHCPGGALDLCCCPKCNYESGGNPDDRPAQRHELQR